MKLIIKPTIIAKPLVQEKLDLKPPQKISLPAPTILPGKTFALKPKKLMDDISEEDIERLAQEMEETARALKGKKGLRPDILMPIGSRKDLTWTEQFKEWGEKRGFKYDGEDLSDMRMDLYRQDVNITQLRLCIIRNCNHFNLGFYFNLGEAGYPKSLDFFMIRKARVMDALNYMYNALSLFDEKE